MLSEIHCITTQPFSKGQPKRKEASGGKHVLKYTLDDELVCEFSSVITASYAARLTPSTFRRHIQSGQNVILGFRWVIVERV